MSLNILTAPAGLFCLHSRDDSVFARTIEFIAWPLLLASPLDKSRPSRSSKSITFPRPTRSFIQFNDFLPIITALNKPTSARRTHGHEQSTKAFNRVSLHRSKFQIRALEQNKERVSRWLVTQLDWLKGFSLEARHDNRPKIISPCAITVILISVTRKYIFHLNFLSFSVFDDETTFLHCHLRNCIFLFTRNYDVNTKMNSRFYFSFFYFCNQIMKMMFSFRFFSPFHSSGAAVEGMELEMPQRHESQAVDGSTPSLTHFLRLHD